MISPQTRKSRLHGRREIFSQQRDLPRSVTHRYSLIIDSADSPVAV
jgi:hypothetical protein